MTDARFVWTPLPNHTWPDGELRLSVYLAPRLGAKGTVKDYEALHDWPSVLAKATFKITVDGGPEFEASPQSKADSGLWQRLFPLDLPIRAFEFQDHALKNLHVFPVRPILQFIEDTYGALAKDAGLDHPSIDDPGAPLRPILELTEIVTQVADLGSFHEELNDGQPLKPVKEGPQPVGEVKVDPWHDGGIGQDFMQGYRFYYRPGNRPKKPPTDFKQPYPPKPTKDEFDFARIVAMLGDYPELLRRLGLIVDLTIDDSIPDQGVMRVEPVGIPGIVPVSAPIGTSYERDEAYFWASPADQARMHRGLLRLSREWFDLFQVDVDGALMKLVDFADTLSRLRDRDRRSDATPGEAPVPTLRGGGLSVARWGRGYQLIDDLVSSRDLNDKIDSGKDVVLSAEDLLRGYRVDVWDADAPGGPRWFSLHHRKSTHTVADLAAGGEPTKIEHEDEGYLKGAGATSESEDHPSASKDLYLHETMFGWEGWSLSVPRPGTRIVEPGQGEGGGEIEPFDPEKDNPLPIVTRTASPDRTLPRLRFGHTYRLRARLADLGGGGLEYVDGELPDPAGDLTSPERRYLRYEPVPSPTVLRRYLDTEGESLEHLVIRSNDGVTAAAYPELPAVVAALEEEGAEHAYREDSQRHLAPPKTSQLMAEQHGRFDTAFGGAAAGNVSKALHAALREEGSFLDRTIVDLSTGKPTINQQGIALHPPVAPQDWPAKGSGLDPGQVVLFSDGSVLLPYLPDPLAVGVAVTGYDHTGTEKFHAVAPFDGTWPELKPFRIRLSEAPGAQPKPPSAKFEEGVLQVRLWKADVVRVRLSSIFPADDLDLFAVWDLISAPAPDLKQRALEGRHWMLTPFRWLNFTHAVQQPLQDPVFAAVQPEPRPLGATSATFRGPIGCHAKSTGRLDVMASWTEDVDLVTDEDGPRWKAGGNPVEKRARAFGFDIDPDEEAAQVTVERHVQDGWRWCRRCEGLFFGGGSTKGTCPAEAGAVHADDASGNYVLAHNDEDAPGQAGWRWCNKCQGLFFAGAGSDCPAGGEHDAAGSGAYTLVHQQPNAPGQNGWRYCSKCRGLAWGVDQPAACPADGVHDHSASGVYTLRTVVATPQDRISRHEFGDTKYRRIQYHTVATTRFREYLPPALYRDDESVLQRVETTLHTRDVLSSARPAAPDVAYVVPTFGWETTEEGDATVHVRRGKGVRVYVRRPWFSSGDGELLGVVLRRPEARIFRPGPQTVDVRAPIVAAPVDVGPAVPVRAVEPVASIEPASPPPPNPSFDPAKPPMIAEGIALPPGVISAMNKDPLEGFVTAWGSDPVWRSAYPPESPSAIRFPSRVDVDDDLTLEELAPAYRVAVAAHAVQYHPTRRLWYADIGVDMGDAYFPFVRLALARYQRNSVDDAHLSRVVMTDFVQLAPDRRTAVHLGGDAAEIEVQGVFGMNRIADSPPSGEKPEPTTDVWARLEVHDDAMGGDLAWKPASDPVELKPVVLNGYRVTWAGSIGVPASALGAGTHRLMITETERYRRDVEPGDPMYAHNVYTGSRIVFADEFVL